MEVNETFNAGAFLAKNLVDPLAKFLSDIFLNAGGELYVIEFFRQSLDRSLDIRLLLEDEFGNVAGPFNAKLLDRGFVGDDFYVGHNSLSFG